MDSQSGEVVSTDTYDSVFYATGRKADTSGIGLETVGVKVGSGADVGGIGVPYVMERTPLVAFLKAVRVRAYFCVAVGHSIV